MSRHQLEVEYDFDFHLIGINSPAGDYRICWSLNQLLALKLSRSENMLEIKSRKGISNSRHSYYTYYDDEINIYYKLLANRSGSGLIIPEHKTADYLLLIDENPLIDIAEVIESIKKIKQVVMAFIINLDDLKSKENLLI